MGHTTTISDYELGRGDGPPPCEGYDIEAPAAAPPDIEEPPGKPGKPGKPPPGQTEEVEEVDVEALTVAELRAQLDELGVDYASNDHKADLQEKLYAALG